ncbi:MAG: hypothetical protein M1575_02845 [Patescibacteria group bacterium]|nr:hypothetical protein [Patescibacteria group bacterium]MCL5095642.1 hypothetical protein [Patescibacteria group bacterium]
MGYTTRYFREFVAKNKSLLVFMGNSNPDIKSPAITINGKGIAFANIDRNVDLVVPNTGNIYLSALKTIIQYSHFKALQNTLKESVERGDIQVVPALYSYPKM